MDPTHLIWSQDIPQYMPAVGLNTIMRSIGYGTVVQTSDESKFPVGSAVTGVFGVVEYALVDAGGLSPAAPGVPPTWNIGPFHPIQVS